MTKLTQTPGRLDIIIAESDAMSILLDFDIDMTGYTFTGTIEETDNTTTAITVTPSTDLTTGQFTLTLASTDVADLAVATHKWSFDRTNAGSERRWLAGDFEVIEFYE